MSDLISQKWLKKTAAFLTGQTISMFGSSLVQFAIIWYIAKTTNSGSTVAISTICAFLPQVFISLFAGVWADRYNRKFLVIIADASIAISTLILAIFMINGYEKLWMIFLISAIRSMGTGLQSPSVSAIIPQIVPEDRLIKVNGINGSLMSLVNLVSPAIGGAILTYGKIYNILFIDVITAVIGIGILSFIKIPLHEKAKETKKTDYIYDLKEGIKYSLTHPFINKLLIFYMIFTILIVPAAFLNVLMVTRVFGDTYWNLTLNEISFFLGAMLGGIIIASWGGFKNRLITLSFGCFMFGILTFAVGFIQTFWVYLIVIGITGFTMPLFDTPVMTLIQEKVEADMQGRVFSFIQIAFSTMMPLGMIIFGPLSDMIPIQWLMIGTGAMLSILSICMLNVREFMKQGLKA